jgi:hypothetical protein
MSLPDLLKTTKQKLDPMGALSAVGGAAPASSATLSFSEQTQEQDQWCWAAVTVSVSHFYDPASGWIQCSLVNAEFGRGDCCWNGNASPCNQPWSLDSPLSRTANLNRMEGNATLFQDLIIEIDRGRLLGCRIGWTSGGGHFVVIQGYSDGANGSWVSVADPFYGPSTYTYDSFCTSYRNSGQWTHSYYTQQN